MRAQEASPITITPQMGASRSQRELLLKFHVPEHNHLYADRLSVEIAGQPAKVALPDATMELDKHSGKTRGMYAADFTASVPLDSTTTDTRIAVNLQGCNDTECFFPETREWIVHPDQTISVLDQAEPVIVVSTTAQAITAGFQITQRASGFLGKKEFLSFLDRGTGNAAQAENSSAFSGMGTLAIVGLILLGGLALNLTPCVLPMIPINLAILGAGVNGGNRRRSVALGAAYGLGMAAAYGGLGLIVVLTGSKFGTLNSSPWFNFAIAVVFLVLALAMFDKITIDFSRFQRGGGKRKAGSAAFIGAAVMGTVSALLAGACVAPVVISVLLLATTHYQQGNLLGLLFPFVLGLGMALPWPFAAGGLSFLPKPGRWMIRVKYAFGVFIFAFGLWYAWLGITLARSEFTLAVAARDANHSITDLRAVLDASRQTGKPVLVDFWASWCKNCEAMEHTTFCDGAVEARLKNFQVVRIQAERLNDSALKPLLDELNVLGLPTFVVLRPETSSNGTPLAKTAAQPSDISE